MKLINSTLIALIDQEDNVQSALSVHALEAEFHAIRRLVASKAGFQAFTELPRYLFQTACCQFEFFLAIYFLLCC